MKRYRYSYQTIVRYDLPISHHHFLLRCVPRNGDQQRVIDQQLHLLSPSKISQSFDTFGNDIRYGSILDRHDIFVIALSGVVDCTQYMIFEENPSHIFLSPTSMTQLDDEIAEFGRSISYSGTPLDQAIEISKKIYEYMSYTPSSTNAETPISISFKMRQGVCQDYAHLLIALCRDRAILARYVAGFVLGTGETHAWVEVFSDGVWHGVDPTHNNLLKYGYIKISHGRDAADCSVTRGIHRGMTQHTTQVNVVVEELGNGLNF